MSHNKREKSKKEGRGKKKGKRRERERRRREGEKAPQRRQYMKAARGTFVQYFPSLDTLPPPPSPP